MNNLDLTWRKIRMSWWSTAGLVAPRARSWECYDAIVDARSPGWRRTKRCLFSLANRSAYLKRTTTRREGINRQLQLWFPHWATWEHFNELDERAGDVRSNDGRKLDLYRQPSRCGEHTSLCVEAGRRHNGTLAGRWVLTAGLERHGRRATTAPPRRWPERVR